VPHCSAFTLCQSQQPTKVQQLPMVSKSADGCTPQSTGMERRALAPLPCLYPPDTSSFHFKWLPVLDQGHQMVSASKPGSVKKRKILCVSYPTLAQLRGFFIYLFVVKIPQVFLLHRNFCTSLMPSIFLISVISQNNNFHKLNICCATDFINFNLLSQFH